MKVNYKTGLLGINESGWKRPGETIWGLPKSCVSGYTYDEVYRHFQHSNKALFPSRNRMISSVRVFTEGKEKEVFVAVKQCASNNVSYGGRLLEEIGKDVPRLKEFLEILPNRNQVVLINHTQNIISPELRNKYEDLGAELLFSALD